MNDFQMRALASDHMQHLRHEADRQRLAKESAARTRPSGPARPRGALLPRIVALLARADA